MRSIYYLTVALWGCLLLASCGTTPDTRYYLLQATAISSADVSGYSIGIGPVQVADYLSRPQIVSTHGSNRLSLAEFDRWGESLDSGITRVLVENMALLTGSKRVVSYPWRSDEQPDVAVRIQILALDQRANNQAFLKARWVVVNNLNKQRIDTGISEFVVDTSDDPSALVGAYSELLLQLSQKLGAVISAAKSSG